MDEIWLKGLEGIILNYMNAKLGDIRNSFDQIIEYKPLIHNFSNMPNRQHIFTRGHVHVAIGFVDLGILSCSNIVGDSPEPLRFIGFDKNPHCIAKTLVLKQMILNKAEPKTVAQVWYSSSWSKSTANSFYFAISKILLDTSVIRKDVKDILIYWQSQNVPLWESRQKWMVRDNGGLHNDCTCIGTLLRKKDRLDMCNYELTGELFESDFGSINNYVPQLTLCWTKNTSRIDTMDYFIRRYCSET
eukprot:NODE_1892_length_1765_cov_40.137028_g1609_i0.p1 GENE.NODE_1892_length_1765_cov_40.137028_g1609_i0~~NODE_1892_length_1765_cov_40.137028_g1609_i0.p1  ORF type:complete len:245 (+),score=29.64 NODE_1892_length_1765_cov_40.137028_g1609_i0:310-1044(+)